MNAVMAMYEVAQTVVRTGYSKALLHQGSVSSLLLFVIVMEMISITTSRFASGITVCR